MNDNEKTIFLSTPAGMFKSIEDTKNCARSLQAFLDYMFKKNGICENSVLIGISNVNGKKAHYISTPNGGVGRPKRSLVGDIENCFVDPHLHILVSGNMAEDISAKTIDYFIKKYKKAGHSKGRRIWKEYVKSSYDEMIVEYYIVKQSFSILTVNHYNIFSSNDELEITDDIINEYFVDEDDSEDFLYDEETSERADLFEYINENEEDSDTEDYCSSEQDSYDFENSSYSNKNRNDILKQMDSEYYISDLRIKWLCLQEFKKIAIDFIVNYELADNIVYLQNEIYFIANSLKNNIYEDYNYKIKNITLEIEKIRNIVYLQKQAYQISLEESKYTNIKNRYYYS